MREIKFRAWDGEGMHYWDSTTHKAVNQITGTPSPKLFYLPMSWLVGDSNDWVWMQYTGLKDKNGKEIYEGDLVWHGRLELEHPLQVSIGGYWPTEGDCGWGVHVYNEDETFIEGVSAFNQDNNLEIIGNIYENPDLLTNNN